MHLLNRKITYIFFIFCSLNLQGISAKGLRFFGRGNPIDKRTSYNVFNEKLISFSGNLEISFELSLSLPSHIGNIVRIKSDNDLIFNLFYNGHDENQLFLLNEEGKSNLISIALDKSDYPLYQWLPISIAFDLKNNTIVLTIGDQTYKIDSISLPDKLSPTIVFGKSDHIIDVPSFAIKNLFVGNKKKYSFPLNEHQGSIVHDINGKEIGHVINPDWLINDSYHWKSEAQFNLSSVAGSNYHKKRQELYYFNRDSLIIYNTRLRNIRKIAFITPCPVEPRLGTNFIDQENDRLYCYEAYLNSTDPNPAIASLDLHTFEWRIESYDRLPTQLHHHASYFDPLSGEYLIFGGFGDRRFSNQFHQYNLDSKKWDDYPLNNRGGITPRYFSSMGHDKQRQHLYLFGGTGNTSGDQLLGREYFYDFYQLNLQSHVITKIWEIPWHEENVVPVRKMLISDDDSFFYTLCYPEHFTESFLKLYRFSMKDGDYTILGDSIPIYSDKINTNANLYYDEDLNTLYAVVHEFEDDIKSDLHIYSLAFPPITEKELANHPPTTKKSNAQTIYYYIIAGMILFATGIILLRRGRRISDKRIEKNPTEPFHHKVSADIDEHSSLHFDTKPKDRPIANSVFLFGEFEVYNYESRDITYLFSKKLKETFCLLLQYSQEKGGITSQHLSRLLWPEKSRGDVKNIRNVTLSRLRKILEELRGMELLYDKGMFTLVQDDQIYCDYWKCMQIISTAQWEEKHTELIEIITRGKFLENEEFPFYDSLKSKTEKQIEPFILNIMERNFLQENYLIVIELAKAAFHIDPMNEMALTFMIRSLQKMGMHEEAKIKYLSFRIDYKRMMGKEYPHSITEL